MLVTEQAAAQPAAMPVSFSAVAGLPSTPPNATLSYGTERSQFGHLWLPPDKTDAPLVVLVHGGCWLSDYGVDHIFALASALAARGYAVWAPEYRRVGEAGVAWPVPAEDLLQGLEQLALVSPGQFDAGRTVLVGHSAGGHLALWLAAQGRALPESFRVAAAVGLAAITDLAAYARAEGSCQSVTPQLMGGMPDDHPELYAEASPAALSYAVPVSLLRGDQDPIVGADQFAIDGAVREQIPGAGHFDLIHPKTPAFDVVLEAIARHAR
jgi:acetyl esterase/lipase